MKKFQATGLWRTTVLLVAILLFACKPTSDGPNDPPDPTLVKPVLSIASAINITDSTAKITAWVIANEDNTQVSFDYKTGSSAWKTNTLPTTFAGKDTIKVSFDLAKLTASTNYTLRVRASNKAGEVISGESQFTTLAIVVSEVVKDYDGNSYHLVKIGNQTWLRENLKATHYANGNAITNITDGAAWTSTRTGAYCWYNNDTALGNIYGALYNWYAATDTRKFIIGYHLPSAEEFTTLQTYLGGENSAAIKMTDASGKYWEGLTYAPTNSSGFTALPSGARNFAGGSGNFIQQKVSCWLFTSSTDVLPISLLIMNGSLSLGGIEPYWGTAVRLIKD